MDGQKVAICPHCGVQFVEAVRNGSNRQSCPVCHRSIQTESPARSLQSEKGGELPELSHSMTDYRVVRNAAAAVFAVTVLSGILLFYRGGFRDVTTTTQQIQLTALSVMGIGAAFVCAYTAFVLNLKSRQ